MQCGETGLAPETLQNIPTRDRWLAGWTVAGKQAKQQTTTPALHNSYQEAKTKHQFWKGINPCHIMPVISDYSASNSESSKGSIMATVQSCSAESIKVFGIILQAHFMAPDYKHCNECYACFNVKTPLL